MFQNKVEIQNFMFNNIFKYKNVNGKKFKREVPQSKVPCSDHWVLACCLKKYYLLFLWFCFEETRNGWVNAQASTHTCFSKLVFWKRMFFSPGLKLNKVKHIFVEKY